MSAPHHQISSLRFNGAHFISRDVLRNWLSREERSSYLELWGRDRLGQRLLFASAEKGFIFSSKFVILSSH